MLIISYFFETDSTYRYVESTTALRKTSVIAYLSGSIPLVLLQVFTTRERTYDYSTYRDVERMISLVPHSLEINLT